MVEGPTCLERLTVLIEKGEREVGRWDMENQRSLDNFQLTRKLRDAPIQLGYLISYNQLHEDSTGVIKVAGGFGYDGVPVASVPDLLDRMVVPRGMSLTKVIVRR